MVIEDLEGVTSTVAPCVARNTRPHQCVHTMAAFLLLAGLALPGSRVLANENAGDSAVALNAKVVWVASDRVVLASSDSLAVEEWDSLQFLDRKKPVATGVVARIYEPGMFAARVTSGSLQGVKKLDHIRVLALHPVAPTPRLLRVGYPSARRSNLLFRCARTTVRVPSGYRADGPNVQRFLRDGIPDPPWPDTLAIQEFDESGDEEIAFERGELDLAIFWPGELSSRERERLDERNHVLISRATGVVAAHFVPSGATNANGVVLADSAGLQSVNQDLFGGDLAIVAGSSRQPSPGSSPEHPEDVPLSGYHQIRVDRACPGWQAFEHALNTVPYPLLGSAVAGSIRVFYRDQSPNIPPTDPSIAWIFRVRCPVLFAPSLRRVLEHWHGETLVDLLECEPGAR